jgi:hypothetical protein
MTGNGGSRNLADPFVIGLAHARGGIVVTEESMSGSLARPRIPDVCAAMNSQCVGLSGSSGNRAGTSDKRYARCGEALSTRHRATEEGHRRATQRAAREGQVSPGMSAYAKQLDLGSYLALVRRGSQGRGRTADLPLFRSPVDRSPGVCRRSCPGQRHP